jgi:hypothetical protein
MALPGECSGPFPSLIKSTLRPNGYVPSKRIIGLIQQYLHSEEPEDLPLAVVQPLYDEKISRARLLMLDKNHDYGEAWRDMSQESFVDLILSKLLRIKQIISNDGKTLVSEGIEANYFDIINYSAFALILIAERKHAV